MPENELYEGVLSEDEFIESLKNNPDERFDS